MKLHYLTPETYFTYQGERFLFKRLDGAYSVCIDGKGNRVLISASAEIEPDGGTWNAWERNRYTRMVRGENYG